MSWAKYACTVYKSKYVALNCVCRMLKLNKNTLKETLKSQHIAVIEMKKQTNNWYYLTFDALHQCMLKIMHWSPDKAAAAIKELERVVKAPSSSLKKKMKKDEDEEEEDSSFVDSAPPTTSSSPSQDADESYPWWPEFCSEMYRLTNPATFTTVLQSQEFKVKCTELLDIQVESKMKRTYDESKEEIASLESVHKRLKTSDHLIERVKKEIDVQCRQEKSRPFNLQK